MFKYQQLNFKNWIPFHGNQKIIFSTDDEKNVTFINADNQAGKTAILRGILWCMHGHTNDQNAYLEHVNRLNLQAKAEQDYSYEVVLKFEYDSQNYVITRKANLKNNLELKEDNWETHLTCNIDSIDSFGMDAQKKINEVFDLSTSRFYLFDGEMLQEYKKLINTNNMSTLAKKIISSIEDILRITTLRNAKSSLDVIHNVAVKQARKDKNKQGTLKTAYDKIETKQKELEILEEEKIKLEKDKKQLEVDAEEARKALDNNPGQQELAKEVKNLTDTLIPNCKKDIISLEQTVNRNASQFFTIIIEKEIKNIKKQVEKKIDGLNVKVDKYKKIDVYQSILKDIDISKESKKIIKEQIPDFKEADRKGLDVEIFDLKSQLHVIKSFDSSNTNKEILVDKYQKLKSEKESLEIHQARYEEIIDRFGGDKDNVDLAQKHWDTYATNKELIGKIDYQLDESNENSNVSKISKLKKDIDDIQRTMPKSTGDSLSSNREMIARQYKTFFEDCIESLVNDTKSTIQESANNMYSRLSAFRVLVAQDETGLNLEVTDNFGLQVKTSDGEILEASAGGSQIVGLSLIWALRSQLKEAPLLMDTGFGRLDNKFREAILTIGPEMGTQFILLVQDGEVAEHSDLHGIIYNNIGQSYKLNKMTDKVTDIEQL